MKGQVDFRIRNNQIAFHFLIERNITVLRGNSATGKTKLIHMVRDYYNLGESSGIKLICDRECAVLEGRNWVRDLEHLSDTIVFIDEGNSFLHDALFARMAKESSNYYVIASRNPLYQLPYSIEAILEIKRNARYPRMEKMNPNLSQTDLGTWLYDLVITEDSQSGFAFFQRAAQHRGIPCQTAGGKSNLLKKLKEHEGKRILLVADAAALGCEVDALCQYQKMHEGQVTFFFPESFEWLILKSGLIRDGALAELLEHPADHIECADYFSWERYFFSVLQEMTAAHEQMRYSKTRLLPYYTNAANAQKILDAMRKPL